MTQENEHFRTLVAARNRELEHRRDVAKVLAEKYNRGHTEKWELFISIQSTIEAIDRALADEGQLANEPGGRQGFRIGHQ
jgi:hypothetical protein